MCIRAASELWLPHMDFTTDDLLQLLDQFSSKLNSHLVAGERGFGACRRAVRGGTRGRGTGHHRRPACARAGAGGAHGDADGDKASSMRRLFDVAAAPCDQAKRSTAGYAPHG